MSQYRILAYDRPELIKYDFVGRFEQLAQDYGQMQKHAGVDFPPLPHRLRTQGPNEYLEMYNDRCIELVGRRYARDIDLFGYDFDRISPA